MAGFDADAKLIFQYGLAEAMSIMSCTEGKHSKYVPTCIMFSYCSDVSHRLELCSVHR